MVFLCPYDEEDIKNIDQRAARDEDGEVYYVPDNMTYQEWKKAFVDGDVSESKKFVVNVPIHDIMKLSDEELGAIMRYKSFDSYLINDAFRNEKDISKLSTVQQQFISNLDSALSKMPKYNGHLIRTVDFSDYSDKDKKIEQFMSVFVPEKMIVIDQYWSTSKKEGYSKEPSIKIYIQNSKNG